MTRFRLLALDVYFLPLFLRFYPINATVVRSKPMQTVVRALTIDMQEYGNDNHYHYAKLKHCLMTLNSFPLLKF